MLSSVCMNSSLIILLMLWNHFILNAEVWERGGTVEIYQPLICTVHYLCKFKTQNALPSVTPHFANLIPSLANFMNDTVAKLLGSLHNIVLQVVARHSWMLRVTLTRLFWNQQWTTCSKYCVIVQFWTRILKLVCSFSLQITCRANFLCFLFESHYGCSMFEIFVLLVPT